MGGSAWLFTSTRATEVILLENASWGERGKGTGMKAEVSGTEEGPKTRLNMRRP